MLSLNDYKKRIENIPGAQSSEENSQNIGQNNHIVKSNESIPQRILNSRFVRRDILEYLIRCKEKNKIKEKIHSKGFSACEGENRKFNQELEEDAVFDNPYSIHHMERAYGIWSKDSLFPSQEIHPSAHYDVLRKTQNVQYANHLLAHAKKLMNSQSPQPDKAFDTLNNALDFYSDSLEGRLHRAKVAGKLTKWDVVLEDTNYLLDYFRNMEHQTFADDFQNCIEFFEKYGNYIRELNEQARRYVPVEAKSIKEDTPPLTSRKKKRKSDSRDDFRSRKRARSTDRDDYGSYPYDDRSDRPWNDDRYYDARSPDVYEVTRDGERLRYDPPVYRESRYRSPPRERYRGHSLDYTPERYDRGRQDHRDLRSSYKSHYNSPSPHRDNDRSYRDSKYSNGYRHSRDNEREDKGKRKSKRKNRGRSGRKD